MNRELETEMPWAPKRIGGNKQHRKPWQRSGEDKRAGFRGKNRQDAKMRILIRDNCECRSCGKLVDTHDSYLDHIVPISQGGGHEDENLQTLCIRCSNRKTACESRVRRNETGR